MLNTISIQGRFVETPDLKTTKSGSFVTAFSFAVPRDYKDKNGKEITDFFTCVAWTDKADFICKHFEKGAQAIINGSLETRKYKDKNDATRTAYEIKVDRIYFVGSKQNEGGQAAPQSLPSAQDFEEITDEDDLPF